MEDKIEMKSKAAWNLKNIITYAFLGLVVIEICCLIYYNFATNYAVDQDSAKLMYHTIKMWENKSLIIPDWTYMTTGEWDCSSMLAMPIYGITGNIILSFAIANTLNIFIFSVIVWVLMKSVNISNRYIFLALAIILMPYSWGMLNYANMLFYSGAQYIYKVLLPIALLALFHYTPKKQNIFLYMMLYVFTEILVFMTISSSSIFVIACGIIPIFACRILYMFVKKELPSKKEAALLISTTIVMIGAYLMHIAYGVASNADGMSLRTLEGLSGAFTENNLNLLSIMQVLPSTGVKVLSGTGAVSLLKCIIFSFIIIFAVPIMNKFLCLNQLIRSKTAKVESISDTTLLQSELISIFICNYLVTLLTSSTPRYLLVGFISMILAAVIQYSFYDAAEIVNILLIGALLVLNLFIQREGCIAVRTIFTENYKKEICEKILDAAKEQEAELIVIYDSSEWAEVIRAYDSDYPTVTYYSINDNIWDFDCINKTEASDLHDLNSILVVLEGRENELLDQVSDKYQYVYWEDIDGASIYKKSFKTRR